MNDGRPFGLGLIPLGLRRFRRLLGIAWSDRLLRSCFLTILAIDIAWILWFGIAKGLLYAEVTEDLYALKHLRITKEGSWPEQFNYAKTFVLAGLLAWLTIRERRFVYFAMALVFAVVLADDAMAIHENFGGYLRKEFDIGPMFGVRGQDVGEVITWALFGVILGPLMLFGVLGAKGVHRANGLALLVTFVALVFCAIFVDQLYHSYSEVFLGAGIILDMIEDGGEMVVITAACTLAAVLVRHGPEAGLATVGAADAP